MSAEKKPSRLFDPEPFTQEPERWEIDEQTDVMVAHVAFNRPLETTYDYQVSDAFRDVIQPGARVRVSLGRGAKLTTGYCVGVTLGVKPDRPLKPIAELLDREPLINASMLKLTRWIADYYLCSWGQVLESVIPAGVKNNAGTREINMFQLAAGFDTSQKLPKKQQVIVNILNEATEPLTADEITQAADCGTGPLQTLRKKGIIEAIRRRVSTFEQTESDSEQQTDLKLNEDQQKSLSHIIEKIQKQESSTLLLHGVTGSGKTEVYIQAIREVVSYGKQAIVLVPEISLTPQTIRRFRARFPEVAVLHSHLTDAERHWQWQRIASGDVQVVVGARSAVFAPVPRLGLIIIDEEHETTFKQETTPRYHAREVARQRAEMERVPLVLGSATPTLESIHKAKIKEYEYLSMPVRVDDLPMPPVSAIDTRNDPLINQGQSIGRAMKNGMLEALKDGGQAILFFNLRGFTPVLWCKSCRTTLHCPHCDTSLTWHKDRKHVRCHTCDYENPLPDQCPSCGASAIQHLGAGTQRLEEEVRGKFPGYKCLRMDSDAMRKPGSHDIALEQFRAGDVKILLGTQMIAKGLDFPNVTFVGVVDADTMLHQPDFRASERTFQLISQVAGRTGRSRRGGRVFVQSSSPDEPAIQRALKHDYIGFAKAELQHREDMMMPPFAKLVRIIIRGKDETVAETFSAELTELLKDSARENEVRVLGPAPAPIARLRNYYRFHIQMAAESLELIRELWGKITPQIKLPTETEMAVDVEPINMR